MTACIKKQVDNSINRYSNKQMKLPANKKIKKYKVKRILYEITEIWQYKNAVLLS